MYVESIFFGDDAVKVVFGFLIITSVKEMLQGDGSFGRADAEHGFLFGPSGGCRGWGREWGGCRG